MGESETKLTDYRERVFHSSLELWCFALRWRLLHGSQVAIISQMCWASFTSGIDMIMIETNPGMNLVDASIPGAVHEAVCELLCPLRRLRRSSLRVGTYEARPR